MSFSGDVEKFRAKVKAKTEAQVRAVTLELFSRVIMKTAVDTGRARGAWAVSFGPVPNWTDPGTEDKAGSITITTVSGELVKIRPDQITWLANGLPYIVPLEYGHSKQSPQGMVRLSLMEMDSVLDAVKNAEPA